MTSQPVASAQANTRCVEISSYVRGVHAYKHLWQPRAGQILTLQREPENAHDAFAVAVKNHDSLTVGHVPKKLASLFSHFLKRDCNKAVAEITGKRINRGGGLGLEAPAIYKLFGPSQYLDRILELLERSTANE